MKYISKGLVFLLLALWAAICIYPLLWMFGASLKAPMDVMKGYNLLPKGVWHWETYIDVWERLKFFSYFLNSVNVTFWVLVGVIVFHSMAAFAFAKLKFKGKNAIFYLFLGMMFVPSITVLIPLYITENLLGIINTHLGLILPMVNGAAPFAIFLMRNYFLTIPHELFEYASSEGCSRLGIMVRIYIPLSLPAIATIATLNFFSSWNSLVLPMIILNNKKLFTLTQAVMLLDTGVFRKWNVLMAGSLISLIPVIIAFLFLQKYYIEGLSSGAVKA